MGYLFIFLALLMGATKGYCGKKTSGVISTLPATMMFNSVRMLICIPIGLLFVLVYTGTLTSLKVSGMDLVISALSGIATSAFVVSWILAVRKGAYMMVDVFLTLGVIVPVALCAVFFGEAVKWNQILGIAMLVGATYIMCSYSNTIKEKISPKTYLLLLFSGIANGLTQFAQKWFLYQEGHAHVSVFNLYTYVFSSVVLLVCFMIASRKDKSGITELTSNVKRLSVYVVIMSLCLFLHSLFSTMAGGRLDASQVYPLMQGGGLTLSMIMSAVLFKEKITVRCIVGILITFAALLIINLL